MVVGGSGGELLLLVSDFYPPQPRVFDLSRLGPFISARPHRCVFFTLASLFFTPFPDFRLFFPASLESDFFFFQSRVGRIALRRSLLNFALRYK